MSWKRRSPLIKAREAACVFGSGYLANIGTIPALVGKGDLILADKFVHACMIDARAAFRRNRHALSPIIIWRIAACCLKPTAASTIIV